MISAHAQMELCRKMPVARYFFLVGGVLLALLFASDAYGPKSPMARSTQNGVDLSVIRIHSDQKWPERIVFDTSLPTIVPAVVTAEAVAPMPVASAAARVRESFAQFTPPEKSELQTPRKRKVAKTRTAPQRVLFAQQSRPGLFSTW
jgi:hypothetical protein